MTLPDRPVSGASIESEWGQAVHDYTFAPSGCWVHGTTGTSVGTSFSKQNLSLVDEDPGGYLDAANNQVEIPTDREGLYIGGATMRTVNGSAGSGQGTRSVLRLNGTDISYGNELNAGGTNITFYIPLGPTVLAAGDILTIYSQRYGGGTNPDVTVVSFTLVRIGAEFGA